LHESQGQFAQAEPLYKRSLAIREKLLGSNHPAVAENLKNMAALYRKTGRIQEADEFDARATAMLTLKH
jgi:tetratricopeptide (TPR) repeat protein